MRFAVESWAPEYGAPVDDDSLAEADTSVDTAVEVPTARWEPIGAPAPTRAFDSMLLVDGVRRIEAHLWITGEDGVARHGICASYAAGAVRCDGAARLVAAEVRRGLFCQGEGADALPTRHGTFELVVAAEDDPARLVQVLQARMGSLEALVAASAAAGGAAAAEVTVVDGPLKRDQQRSGMVGYVKTHQKSYGEQIVRDVIGALGTGERTPLMVIGREQPRYSWYLRLPSPARHAWAGVVRLEVSTDRPVSEAVELADRLSRTLPAYASSAHKDPRAPQNLVPIGGLERELRHRLGDPLLLLRSLQEAAAG